MTACAKSAFSDRKPYPGWMLSAPDRVAASTILAMSRYVSAAVSPPRANASSAICACMASRSGSA